MKRLAGVILSICFFTLFFSRHFKGEVFTCGADISREGLLPPPVAGVYTAKAVAGKLHSFRKPFNRSIIPLDGLLSLPSFWSTSSFSSDISSPSI